MDDIILAAQLRDQGLHPSEVGRLLKAGKLTRVRRGAYVRSPSPDDSVENRHRRVIAATFPQLSAGAVVSHGSAAVLHGLPVWPATLQRVHITRNRAGGGKTRQLVQVHGAALSEGDVTLLDDIVTTSLLRTTLDLCRTVPHEQAVAAGDKALALGLSRAELSVRAEQLGRQPGIGSARRAIAFLDGRSESAGESVSRVRLAEDGLPKPELQLDIFDADGRFVARPDFVWEDQRTIGEFDGRIKYGRLLKPGQRIEDVIFAEKLREDCLRDLGWQVVRWVWADLYRPGVIRKRLLRAFTRSGS